MAANVIESFFCDKSTSYTSDKHVKAHNNNIEKIRSEQEAKEIEKKEIERKRQEREQQGKMKTN